jgi:[acyl-carrier-protein] S-malonyltransferase
MGRALAEAEPGVRELFDLGSQLSGFDLSKYCWDGPHEELARTDILQPSVAVTDVASWLTLQQRGIRPTFVAGHSLGEFVALYAAGVLGLGTMLKLVSERGRLMHEASLAQPGVMTAVSDAAAELVEQQVAEVAARLPAAVANYNSPRQVVISGHALAVAEVENVLSRHGARLTRLAVSGAWHSPLMQGANQAFRELLARTEFNAPRCRIYLNSLGREAKDLAEIREAVAVQMVSPVRWSALTEQMIAAGVNSFIEVGPGRVLRGLLRHIWTDFSAYSVHGTDTPAAVMQLARQLDKVA